MNQLQRTCRTAVEQIVSHLVMRQNDLTTAQKTLVAAVETYQIEKFDANRISIEYLLHLSWKE